MQPIVNFSGIWPVTLQGLTSTIGKPGQSVPRLPGSLTRVQEPIAPVTGKSEMSRAARGSTAGFQESAEYITAADTLICITR